MSTTIPKSNETLNTGGHVMNGMLSNTCMLGAMQPVFVIKNSYQNGHGMPPMARWYAGIGANCLGIIPAQGIAFGVNQLATSYLSPEWAPYLAAIASAPAASYFERVAIKQSVLGRQGITITLSDAMRLIHTTEGPKGILRGVVPTSVRDLAWYQALFLGQPRMKALMDERDILPKATRDVASSAVVGALAAGATNPADMVKTRMQSSEPKDHLTLWHAGRKIVVEEGVMALTKGLLSRSILGGGAMVCVMLAKKWLPSAYPDALHKQ